LPVEVRSFDPPRALFDPEGGTGFHRKIARGAVELLRPSGVLILEIGEAQGATVRGLLREAGYADVQVLPDLTGRDRIVRGARDGRGNPWTPSY
jgi:release factor glutamine methyltransferase